MKSSEVYVYRRIALDWSKELLAEKAGLKIRFIDDFEAGFDVDKVIEDKIKSTINIGFKNLDSLSHYNARIVELALELKNETSDKQKLYRISHLQVELGKLQREILDSYTNN